MLATSNILLKSNGAISSVIPLVLRKPFRTRGVPRRKSVRLFANEETGVFPDCIPVQIAVHQLRPDRPTDVRARLAHADSLKTPTPRDVVCSTGWWGDVCSLQPCNRRRLRRWHPSLHGVSLFFDPGGLLLVDSSYLCFVDSSTVTTGASCHLIHSHLICLVVVDPRNSSEAVWAFVLNLQGHRLWCFWRRLCGYLPRYRWLVACYGSWCAWSVGWPRLCFWGILERGVKFVQYAHALSVG